MERGDELHSPEGKLMCSADVHGVAGRALVAAELSELERGDDRRAVALRQRNSVAEVIAVAMGEEDGVQPWQLVGADVCGGITREGGVIGDAVARSLLHGTRGCVGSWFSPPGYFSVPRPAPCPP